MAAHHAFGAYAALPRELPTICKSSNIDLSTVRPAAITIEADTASYNAVSSPTIPLPCSEITTITIPSPCNFPASAKPGGSSPQGRIFQVEYALEAIKQGSAAVGLVSKTHAVLVALKRNAEELGSYQKKIIGIDSHLGIALAGLAPDARVLSNFMRSQSMSSRLLYNRPIPVSRVVNAIADKAQVNTQHYGRRPYGVGLLVAGVDETGPHLWEFQPSGMVLEYRGTAIGARSQSARTYLERNFESFENASKEELVLHGLKALRDSLAQDKELTTLNVSLAVVGIGKNFKLYDGDEVAEWLEKLGDTTSSRGGGARPSAADAPAGGAPVTTGDTEAGAMDTSE